jgi:thiamine-phosphate pyrophosphorylase
MLQIRDKDLPVPVLAERARAAVEIARRRHPDGRALVVVNDRADVAAAVGADGVHTGADDLPLPLVRRVVGPRALLGRTAHDLAEARAAVLDGADCLGVGPCFPSHTKSFAAYAPPEFLAAVASEIALPAFAIGGITLERIDEVAAMGYSRVAVASAVTGAADPAAAAAALIERLRCQRPRQPGPTT